MAEKSTRHPEIHSTLLGNIAPYVNLTRSPSLAPIGSACRTPAGKPGPAVCHFPGILSNITHGMWDMTADAALRPQPAE